MSQCLLTLEFRCTMHMVIPNCGLHSMGKPSCTGFHSNYVYFSNNPSQDKIIWHGYYINFRIYSTILECCTVRIIKKCDFSEHHRIQICLNLPKELPHPASFRVSQHNSSDVFMLYKLGGIDALTLKHNIRYKQKGYFYHNFWGIMPTDENVFLSSKIAKQTVYSLKYTHRGTNKHSNFNSTPFHITNICFKKINFTPIYSVSKSLLFIHSHFLRKLEYVQKYPHVINACPNKKWKENILNYW